MPTCVRRRELERAPHRAGVVVRRPHVRVAQVGVRVDLQHRQPGYFAATAPTTAGVIECSPPRTTGNLPRVTSSEATRRISRTTSSMLPNGNSISGSVKMPMLWTSVCVSSSHNSMCDDATRISCGPVARARARRTSCDRAESAG